MDDMVPNIQFGSSPVNINFWNAYRNWLGAKMDGGDHSILFDIMMDTKFVWSEDIPRDEDRAADGRYLRLRFAEEEDLEIPDEILGYPCSFLEFLVALAYSIEDEIMYDPEEPDRASEWFWTMMRNAGLSQYDDAMMLGGRTLTDQLASSCIDKIMKRRYEPNGDKGLFPLKHPAVDQRDVEIWYQANAYFIEEYFE